MFDYSLLEDEKLVALIKRSDEKAFATLTERFFHAAEYHASRFCNSTEEKEDLTQEGMLGFISAVYAYNENEGASFSTFANHCIKNRIISSVRTANSKKRIPSELVVPLESQENFISEEASPEENVISQTESEKIHSLIQLSLTEKERTVFQLFLSGMTYEQIAREDGCTAKSVDSTLQRVRKKLREKLS